MAKTVYIYFAWQDHHQTLTLRQANRPQSVAFDFAAGCAER